MLTHCSRPASVQYRGGPTERMRIDPATGERLDLNTFDLLTRFTDPDSYLPNPETASEAADSPCTLRWSGRLEQVPRPSLGSRHATHENELAFEDPHYLLGHYPNLWTDIAYTAFADEEFVYLLRVLLDSCRSEPARSTVPTSMSWRARGLRSADALYGSAACSAKQCSQGSPSPTWSSSLKDRAGRRSERRGTTSTGPATKLRPTGAARERPFTNACKKGPR